MAHTSEHRVDIVKVISSLLGLKLLMAASSQRIEPCDGGVYVPLHHHCKVPIKEGLKIWGQIDADINVISNCKKQVKEHCSLLFLEL